MSKKKHVIKVCDGVACRKKGACGILHTAEKTLHIKEGETTQEGDFKLVRMKCPNYCEIAPVIEIDRTFYGNINEYDTEGIIAHEVEKEDKSIK
jgi:NADH-quinone oxidoreductase subunit E